MFKCLYLIYLKLVKQVIVLPAVALEGVHVHCISKMIFKHIFGGTVIIIFFNILGPVAFSIYYSSDFFSGFLGPQATMDK